MKTANPFSERYGWWVSCGLSVIAGSHCGNTWVFLVFASPTLQVSFPPNQTQSCLAHRFKKGCWKYHILIMWQQYLFFIKMLFFSLDWTVAELPRTTNLKGKLIIYILCQLWKNSDDNSHTWILWLVLHALPTEE